MADVVLQTVDLDVFGGPVALDVSVDFGQTGERGSRIWAGSLGPTVDLVDQDVKLYDWYINTGSGRMYQYVLEIGNPTWTEVFNLTLPQLSIISSTTFTSGSATINIPISSLTTDLSTVISDYVIRYSIKGTTAISSSFNANITGSNLSITIYGSSFDGVSWSSLTGSRDVHLFISYKG